jgi:hypothetical protein
MDVSYHPVSGFLCTVFCSSMNMPDGMSLINQLFALFELLLLSGLL